jgi:hypothetical protein
VAIATRGGGGELKASWDVLNITSWPDVLCNRPRRDTFTKNSIGFQKVTLEGNYEMRMVI